MKLQQYLNESAVSKALELGEPDVGGDYPPEKVKRYIEMIDSALAEMSNKEESESNDAIVADLRDKKSKWKNVKKETKPKKTKTELPPEQEEPPPEEAPPAEAPPAEAPQQQQPPPKKEDIIIQHLVKLLT